MIYLAGMWETRDDIPWRLLRLLDRVVVFYVAGRQGQAMGSQKRIQQHETRNKTLSALPTRSCGNPPNAEKTHP
jgi:hypothetical protein